MQKNFKFVNFVYKIDVFVIITTIKYKFAINNEKLFTYILQAKNNFKSFIKITDIKFQKRTNHFYVSHYKSFLKYCYFNNRK